MLLIARKKQKEREKYKNSANDENQTPIRVHG